MIVSKPQQENLDFNILLFVSTVNYLTEYKYLTYQKDRAQNQNKALTFRYALGKSPCMCEYAFVYLFIVL